MKTVAALVLVTASPIAALAQAAPMAAPAAPMMKPTQAQVETALKATHPSLRQMRAIKPMIANYKSAAANAPDEASKNAAAQNLMAGMKTVLSPAQQNTFKQSLVGQMQAAAAAPH